MATLIPSLQHDTFSLGRVVLQPSQWVDFQVSRAGVHSFTVKRVILPVGSEWLRVVELLVGFKRLQRDLPAALWAPSSVADTGFAVPAQQELRIRLQNEYMWTLRVEVVLQVSYRGETHWNVAEPALGYDTKSGPIPHDAPVPPSLVRQDDDPARPGGIFGDCVVEHD